MREHSQLNVKGNSIVPPSDVSTNDVMVSARSAAAAAGLPRDVHFSDMSLTWGLSLFLPSVKKKLKPDKSFMGKPSQNYWVPPKYGVTILLAARHKRAHPTLTPAGEDWYSIYLPRRDGRLS